MIDINNLTVETAKVQTVEELDLYKEINFGYDLLPSTEDLYWHRVKNLWKIYQSITDDLVYKAMWERKLKELMQRGFNGQ